MKLLIAALIGVIAGMIILWLLMRSSVNNTEISTRKIVQKRNSNSSQDITNKITRKPLLERIKAKKRSKRANNN
jgi:hypothetical protein